MANKQLLMIKINSDYIRKKMAYKKISMRKLSKLCGMSDRRMRELFNKGEMSPATVARICNVLGMTADSAILGNTVWMRIGVTVPVTDEELADLLEESRNNSTSETSSGTSFEDINMSEKRSVEFLKRAVADGETYIPGCCLDKYKHFYEETPYYQQITVSGWIARYDTPGINGERFTPGCFDESDGQTIPVYFDLSDRLYGPDKVIGFATLHTRSEGLYTEATIKEGKIKRRPKSFGFYAHHVHRSCEKINKAKIVAISILSYKLDTSWIEEFKIRSKENEQGV